ncbi:ABC transporter substrate-binding protein [Thermotoga sp. SG1]|uniref:ABC transporter substrate-binding protein n=1 Tax=Thermotoga sp. SG1 TaxID=126739 RepID=UPI000C778453|nr:ABC transporter substrate-binding protein [Thermotoga sp. SG1]PLV57421.1 peptide ABC transporter substrate-binding protein [Thermotoga sp. SG1]
MRRVFTFLMISLLVAVGLSWSVYATPEDYYKATGKKIEKFHEAPMLVELVKQGKLPPIEERLPKEPLVVVPEESVGQYGGTWRRVWKGPSDRWGIPRINQASLVFWDKNGEKFVPGLAKGWDILEGGKIYVFHLREGTKWSDGHPYTSEDILFWIEDILGNDDLTPAKPAWYRLLDRVEAPDPYTVKFIFKQPYALFLLQVANRGFTGAPKHFLKQFHPKYTPMEEIEKKMVPGVHNTWVDLFNDKSDFLESLDLPVLTPWKPVTDPTDQFYILERNPYFWAVDIEGNQLPYIDRIRHEYVQSSEVIMLKAISGEIDMQWRHIGLLGPGPGVLPLLLENAKTGGYKVLRWKTDNGSVSMVMLNISDPPDPVLGEVFRDVRFRQALSLAINREEINEILFNGLAEPRQASFVSGSPYYDPEWEKAYAEYDPDRANKLLDEMGLKWGEKHEYRLLPDGRPLRFTIQVTGQTHVDVWTMVKEYWKQIGVWVEIENLERSLYDSRLSAHEFDAQAWVMDRASQPLVDPLWIIPGSTEYAAAWYIGWAEWAGSYLEGEESLKEYLQQEDAIVPPEGIREPLERLLDLWKEIQNTPDPEKIKELMKEVTKIHRENLWMIGTVGEDTSPAIVKNNFKNVPEELVTATPFFSPWNAMPIQFYIEQK